MPRKFCEQLQDADGAKVVPIFLDDSTPWEQAFAKSQGLPADAKPILDPAHWPDPNDAWRQVADKLRGLVSG